jgi:hypothetical protein
MQMAPFLKPDPWTQNLTLGERSGAEPMVLALHGPLERACLFQVLPLWNANEFDYFCPRRVAEM